ncbi:MAG: ChaN family lipoprotein [Bacteroidales bacterium]|jgi:uncharacterized iron-regulated protein
MMKKLLLITLTLIITTSLTVDKPAYLIYNSAGKSNKYQKMIKSCAYADIVLFGELHNNPICHWLEFSLTKDLHKAKSGNIILGAEMFESDNQLILDEYLNSLIKERNFENEAKLWNNYTTDYKPIVEFAKENELKFVATNIPRRYAALVNSEGFEGLEKLSDDAKSFLPPLPILYDENLPCYKNIVENIGMMPNKKNFDNIGKAQAVKDATMAHFIYKNFEKGSTFIHFNGRYHSDNFSSIVWYLNQLDSTLKITTISCVEQDDIQSFEEKNKGIADFIIAIPSDMTKTY